MQYLRTVSLFLSRTNEFVSMVPGFSRCFFINLLINLHVLNVTNFYFDPCILVQNAVCKYHKRALGTDPSIFRYTFLRNEKGNAVKEYREGIDVYTKSELVGSDEELDHVLECHVIRDNFDLIQKRGVGFAAKRDNLADVLRSRVVNEVNNLNFTTKRINRDKFNAIQDFQNSYLDKSKSDHELGLVGCLLENMSLEDRKVSRSTTRRIQREIYKSWEGIEDSLEHEQPLQEEFSGLLHRNIVAMSLKK